MFTPDAAIFIAPAGLFEKLQPTSSETLAPDATKPLEQSTILHPVNRAFAPPVMLIAVCILLNIQPIAAITFADPVADIPVFEGTLPLIGPAKTQFRIMVRMLLVAIAVPLPAHCTLSNKIMGTPAVLLRLKPV